MTHGNSQSLPTLDMFEQLAHERHALRIFQMPQVQRQIQITQDMYRSNWLGKVPDGAATLEESSRRWALFATQLAIMNDTARPKIIWSNTLPHEWMGVRWPGSNWGLDNPDNFYRYLFVDGTSRYEISGQRRGRGPVQESFLLYGQIPGTGLQTMEGATVISSLETRDLHVEPDGSFLITVGPGPDASSQNHLVSGPQGKIIFIRDTLADWNSQFPNQLRVQRVSGPPASAKKTDMQLAEEAALYLRLETEYWLKWFQDFSYDRAPNTVLDLMGRQGRWGLLTTGWFQLAEDEAFVVTLDPLRAAYVEMQIANVWTVTPDYARKTVGLNNAQSEPNLDGSYTFIASPRDPGVWNWIDTDGMCTGTFTLRWQLFEDPNAVIDGAVREAQVIKVVDLKKRLRPETKWVTPKERNQQLADRFASYAMRFANLNDPILGTS